MPAGLAEYTARNNDALQTLVHKHKVNLKPFPDDVLKKLHTLSDDVLTELAAKDKHSARVYASFKAFRKNVTQWHNISELAYYNARNL